MKIAVIGANGKAGRLIVKEALDRGLDVTAVVRHPNQSLAEKVIEKDLFALTQDDIKDFDVIVDAFGVSAGEDPKLHILSLEHLIKLLTGTKIRLLVVGGAGSLYLNPEHTMQVQDAEDFPEAYKPVASNMAKALEELRQHKDLAWTYVTPACFFLPDAPALGKYILAGEELKLNDKQESKISYADYAKAMVDEIINAKHIGQRISVLQ